MKMSSVQVAVRARPLSRRELDSNSSFSIEMRGHSTILHKSSNSLVRSPTGGRSNAKEFLFDHSYWSVSANDEKFVRQENVFADLGVPVLESAFQGYNACVFAYGQTGSGKTYTMMGSEDSLGLIPRICEGLFSRMSQEKVRNGEQVSYRTSVSYMEIYNEKVRDLLNSGTAGSKVHSLRVREHPTEGPYVEELSKHDVTDYQGISQLIRLGNSHRVTAATKMNDASSRSHAIFTIKFIQATYKDGLPSEIVSKIHLVDLAGSERATATGAEGERLKEGGSINKSLVCLGTVISSLAEMVSHHKKPYIPYRDSVLTWLLKDSLGGNSKTIMIATISPAESSYGETLSTLRYASRAKNIVNRPTINEDPNVKLIRDLRAEIQRLKTVVVSGDVSSDPEEARRLKRSTSMSLAEDLYKKEEQFAELTREWAGKWKDIQRIVEENHLALRSEGVKMVVDSKRPHFVGIDPDAFSTGLVFYYLKDGPTTIGARSEHIIPDICISNSDLRADHCQVECVGHRVVLRPLSGECFINHKVIDKATRLSQGDLIQLGTSTVFRFNHPHQAAKLRKRHNQGLLLPSQLELQNVPQTTMTTLPLCSPTTTTMTVELQSRTSLTANRRRKSGTSLTVNRHHQSEKDLEWWGEPPSGFDTGAPAMALDSQTAEQSFVLSATRRSCCCVLLLWMLAPLFLGLAGVVAVPAVSLLVVLLVCFKVLGISQNFRISRWMRAPLSLSSFLVSPITGLQAIIFRVTFGLLKLIGIFQLDEEQIGCIDYK